MSDGGFWTGVVATILGSAVAGGALTWHLYTSDVNIDLSTEQSQAVKQGQLADKQACALTIEFQTQMAAQLKSIAGKKPNAHVMNLDDCVESIKKQTPQPG